MYGNVVKVLFVTCIVCGASARAEEADIRVELGSKSVRQYGRLEMLVTGVGQFELTGDPSVVKLDAELVSPSGKKVVAPGFAKRATKEVKTEKDVKWEPYGDWLWRIRYMPDKVGTYKGQAVVTTKEGQRRSEQFSFEVTKSDSKGIIRIARKNPWAFEYSDGSPYVAIGHNLGWAGEKRLENYREWLNKMAANDCNYIRVWLGSYWCFGVQTKEAFVYNEDAAELMDRVLELCEQRDIAIMVCFGNNIHDYLADRGGAWDYCKEPVEFLTNERAKQQWKALQRYCVARYGASRSIFAWEMWNEMVANFGHEDKVAEWTEQMCQHVKSIDPHGHLAVNSTGMHGLQVYRKPSVDISQYHRYGGAAHDSFDTPQTGEQALFEIFAGRVEAFRELGKPVLLSEVGLAAGDWGPHPVTSTRGDGPKDKKGYAFHEGLWIGFMDGGAGTGHAWWWDGPVHLWDYYPQYKPFAKFVSGVPYNEAPMPPTMGKVEPANLRCFVRQNDWGALAWVVNANNGWHELVVEGKEVEKVSGGKLTLSGLKQGKYRVEFMDPWTGATKDGQVEAADGSVEVSLPDFEVDVAVKLLRTG